MMDGGTGHGGAPPHALPPSLLWWDAAVGHGGGWGFGFGGGVACPGGKKWPEWVWGCVCVWGAAGRSLGKRGGGVCVGRGWLSHTHSHPGRPQGGIAPRFGEVKGGKGWLVCPMFVCGGVSEGELKKPNQTKPPKVLFLLLLPVPLCPVFCFFLAEIRCVKLRAGVVEKVRSKLQKSV